MQLSGADFAWLGAAPPHEPAAGGITWQVTGGTDFWRETAGHASRHDGDALLAPADGDVVLELTIDGDLDARFDQVGFIAIADERSWLKAGVELDGRPWLGAVHTRGHSDWSREPFSATGATLRLRRAGATVELDVWDGDAWRMFRQLDLAGPLRVGPYACAPAGPGFAARVRDLRLTR
jgi:regulation of enolase protein 1 (concanavalin A-like superfamily)